jgi:isocitrate dehydrogenase
MAMYNTERAIENFAHTCFTHALEHQMPLKLATKTALLRSYDGKFNKVFWEVYEEVYRS